MSSSFHEIFSNTPNNNQPLPVSKWKSQTGITLYLVETEGPIVSGAVCVLTQISNNDGLPHCVEHLVYMGSEEYPYRGFLDRIASRCLCPGLNATTETDHTNYELFTAGSQGFFTILPILLDHLFFPVFTESAYLTEIYHINEDGKDGGVLYTEMQAREHNYKLMMSDEALLHIYPENFGYRYNCGATLTGLRTSTSLQKIKDYHREFYKPENLNIIITGDVDEDQAFRVIERFERKLQPMLTKEIVHQRQERDIDPLLESTVNNIEFPSDSEEFGHVLFAFRGPPSSDQYVFNCLVTVLEYLLGDRTSPLYRALVEEMNVCSEVSYFVAENNISCFKIELDKIRIRRLGQVKAILENELLEIIHNGYIDMEKMNQVISCQMQDTLISLESDDQQETLIYMCIGDALFGSTNSDFNTRLNLLGLRKRMRTECMEYWLDLINDWFVQPHRAVVIGKPSKRKMMDLGKAEKGLIAERKRCIGHHGLQALGDRLQIAIEENQVEAPYHMIAAIPIPAIKDLKFQYFNSSNNYDQPRDTYSLMSLNFDFQVDDIHTNIVQVSALIDTSSLPPRLRFYLPLLSSLLFKLPMKVKNHLMPNKDVIGKLNVDTMSYLATLGIDGKLFHCGKYPQIFVVMINTERKKYEKGVVWLRELLWSTEFSEHEIRHTAEKLLSDIEEIKLTTILVANTILNDILFVPDCNIYVSSLFRQKTFLTQLLNRLISAPDMVIEDLNTIRNTLLTFKNMRVHVAVDTELLAREEKKQAAKPWQGFLKASNSDNRSSPRISRRNNKNDMLPTWEYIRPLHDTLHRHYIMGVGGAMTESLVQCTSGIKDYNHPQLVALKVFMRYLNQEQGPLWQALRGLGVAYGFSVKMLTEHGLLCLEISPVCDVVKAYKTARDVVMGVCTGVIKLKHIDLENAITAQVVDIVKNQMSGQGELQESKLMFYRKVSPKYNRQLLKKLAGVTIPEMKRIGLKYMKPLFDIHCSRSAICCHPERVTEITQEFRRMGFRYFEMPDTANNDLHNI